MNALFVPLALFLVSTGAGIGAELPSSGKQESVTSAAQLSRMSEMEKQKLFNDLGSAREALPSTELSELVLAGLVDASAKVRERALWTISNRAGSPASSGVWKEERATLLSLRGAALERLADSDVNVRLAAIAAVCNVETDQDRPTVEARTLTLPTANQFAARAAVEPSNLARAQLVNAFASYRVPPAFQAKRDQMIEKALSDSSPAVVHAALIGISNQRLASLLPRAVPLLTSEQAPVRVMAAQTFAGFGAQARQFLPDLEQALRSETDDTARKTLEGTIQRIQK